MAESNHASKVRLLDATIRVVRTKGLAATRIEDVCAEAGLTKGSFFHHFKSKEDLALAAVAHWDAMVTGLFAAAPYHQLADPVDRLLAYVDFRESLLNGDVPEITCFAGTIVQEAYRTHPDVSEAAAENILGHARTLEPDITEAIATYGVGGDWTPSSLALYIQAVVHGSLILVKAADSTSPAAANYDHLRRYLRFLFRGSA